MNRTTSIWLGVGVAIGSLIILGLWPSVNRGRELSNRLVCQANMQAIDAAMRLSPGDESVPSAARIDRLAQLGHIQEKQTICPSSGTDQRTYRIVGGATLSASSLPGAVVMFEPNSNHGGMGGNILFADGHAAFHTGSEYDAIVGTAGGAGE